MIIQSIIQWFNIAKPEPTNQDLIKQIAFHCEEFSEMLQAIHCDRMSEQVKELKKTLLEISMKETESNNFMSTVDKVELLDALCDQVVTATGVGVFMCSDFIGALAEVNRSNYTKYDLVDGIPKPKFEDGKISKNTATYCKPKLEQYLQQKDLPTHDTNAKIYILSECLKQVEMMMAQVEENTDGDEYEKLMDRYTEVAQNISAQLFLLYQEQLTCLRDK